MSKVGSLASVLAAFMLAAFMPTAMAVETAEACTMPGFYMTATATGSMAVRSGKTCTITFRSLGPVHNLRVLKRPSHGSLDTPFVFKITYKSRTGYTGSDMFKYELTGFNSRGRRARSVVTVNVTVTP